MTNQNSNSNKPNKYDLEERTLKFSLKVIEFLKGVKYSSINQVIINQLIRSATSIGANYAEANECNSKKDFCHKISICKKEAKETIYWLKIIGAILPDKNAQELQQEAHEFVLIFATILKKS